MAETPDLQKMLKEMEEEINCSVCLGHYQEPKILPCFHYYCTECLQQLAARVGQPVPCPKCRKETTFPLNDARQLPTPFFVNQMIDLYCKMEKAVGKKEAICEMCSNGKAEAFCRQCTEFICGECVKSHRRMKVFSGHEIVSMEQLRGGGAKQLTAQEHPPRKCKEHDEVLKLFCLTCKHLICQDCVLTSDHTDHKREFVKKCAPQCREKLRERLAPLRQTQAKIAAAVSSMQTAKRKVDENLATVSSTIIHSIDQLIEILQQRKKYLLAKASELAAEKLETLNNQEKSLEMALTEAKHIVDFVDSNLEHSTDEEILEMQHQLIEGVEESCKKQQQIDLQPAAEANIGIDMSCDQHALGTVGLVGVNVIDFTKCRAEGIKSETVEINRPAHFTLYLTDSSCHSYTSVSSVVAEAKSHVDGSVVSAVVTPHGNGTYNVTYTPHVRGRHYVTVRVNGREICDSPFSVFVRIPPAQLQQPVRWITGVKCARGIAIGNNDEVLVAEYDGAKVSIFDKQGRELQSLQHDDLTFPYGITTDADGNIYASSRASNAIVKFTKLSHTPKIAKKQDHSFYFMRVINNMLYACCGSNHAVLVYDCDTLQLIRSFGQYGEGNGEFKHPHDVLSVNEELYVADSDNHRIQTFDLEGLSFVRSFMVRNTSTQQLYKPHGICVGPDGLLYVACYSDDPGSCCVLVFTLKGEFVTSLDKVGEPIGIAVDGDGFVYVRFYFNNAVGVL